MADPANASAPALVVRDVSYAYGARRALDAVDLTVRHGRFTALLGPNGAGKTTLFSLITRLFDTRQGSIEIEGRVLAQAGARALAPIGVVFQQLTLDLDLTVRQNLRYFGALRGLPRRQVDERAEAYQGAQLTQSGQRASDKGLLPVTLDEYLKLLDWTGRSLASGKAGAIPAHLAPILDRLRINKARWLDLVSRFDKLFSHVVGTATQLTERAAAAGRHWHHGWAECADAFG